MFRDVMSRCFDVLHDSLHCFINGFSCVHLVRGSVAQKTRQLAAVLTVKFKGFPWMQLAVQYVVSGLLCDVISITTHPAMLFEKPKCVVLLATARAEVLLAFQAAPNSCLLGAVATERLFRVISCS